MQIFGLMKSPTFEQDERWLTFKVWRVNSEKELNSIISNINEMKEQWDLEIEYNPQELAEMLEAEAKIKDLKNV